MHCRCAFAHLSFSLTPYKSARNKQLIEEAIYRLNRGDIQSQKRKYLNNKRLFIYHNIYL